MTTGKMVSELLIYAKSAIIFFYQLEASFSSHMTTVEASDLSKFSQCRFGIFDQF